LRHTGEALTFRHWLKEVYRRPRWPFSRPAKVFAGLPYLIALLAAVGFDLSGYSGREAWWLVWLGVFGVPAAAMMVLACRPDTWAAGARACLAGMGVGVLFALGILAGMALVITVIDLRASSYSLLFTGALLGGAAIGAVPAVAAGHLIAWRMETAADRPLTA
jgi:uncharacterized membrane protein YhaH (DUF805 family)